MLHCEHPVYDNKNVLFLFLEFHIDEKQIFISLSLNLFFFNIISPIFMMEASCQNGHCGIASRTYPTTECNRKELCWTYLGFL